TNAVTPTAPAPTEENVTAAPMKAPVMIVAATWWRAIQPRPEFACAHATKRERNASASAVSTSIAPSVVETTTSVAGLAGGSTASAAIASAVAGTLPAASNPVIFQST